jgi:Galactosyltransferase
MYSQDVVHKLYEAMQRENYFWIDDVLVTGVAARKVQAQHRSIRPWQWKRTAAKQMLKNTTKLSHEQSGRFVFGPFELKAEDILELWALRSNNRHLTPASTLGIGVNVTN